MANDVDAQGGISIKSVTSEQGTATVENGKISFTPNANFNGNATITYIVTDGEFDDTGTVNVSIAPVNDPVSGLVIISGIAQSGEILTASNTLTDVDGMGSVTYTWSDGTNDLGTSTVYTLTDTEVGKKITVKASYIDNDGNAEAKTSVETAPVEAKDEVIPPQPIYFTTEVIPATEASMDVYGADYSSNPNELVIKLTLTADMSNVTDSNVYSIAASEVPLNIDWNQFESFDYGVNGSALFEGKSVIDTNHVWQYVASDLTPIKETLNNTKEPIKLLVSSIDTTANPPYNFGR